MFTRNDCICIFKNGTYCVKSNRILHAPETQTLRVNWSLPFHRTRRMASWSVFLCYCSSLMTYERAPTCPLSSTLSAFLCGNTRWDRGPTPAKKWPAKRNNMYILSLILLLWKRGSLGRRHWLCAGPKWSLQSNYKEEFKIHKEFEYWPQNCTLASSHSSQGCPAFEILQCVSLRCLYIAYCSVLQTVFTICYWYWKPTKAVLH